MGRGDHVKPDFKLIRAIPHLTWCVLGYRVGDVKIKLKKPCADVEYYLKTKYKHTRERKPMLVCGPMMAFDERDLKPCLALPIPDNNFCFNEVAATISRFATEMPDPKPDRAMHFYSYAKSFIMKNWNETVLDEDIPSLATFLREMANYSGSRVKNLLKLRSTLMRTCNSGNRKTTKCKGFIKHETYPEYKAPRAINSYTDESKTLLAPLCHAIDKKTFKSKFFVKGSNPKTWPERLENLFGGEPVVGTDFTAFESHHRGVFAKAVRFWMLHMVRKVSGNKPLKDLIALMTSMRNECAFKHTIVEVDERLMSGAMWTSSANGVLNLLINSYLAADAVGLVNPDEMADWSVRDFKAVFEGDDGLAMEYGQKDSTIEELGLVLKLERQMNYSRAGFCGIVCERGRPDVLKDPRDVVAKFFWLPPKYGTWRRSKQMGLLRAKALSYKYTFGNSPIIGEMCDWVLRETSGHCENWDAVHDGYHMQLDASQMLEARKSNINVTWESRVLVEERFGISVQAQMLIESAFLNAKGKTCLLPAVLLENDILRLNKEKYCLESPSMYIETQPEGECLEQLIACYPLRIADHDPRITNKFEIADVGPYLPGNVDTTNMYILD